MNVTDIAKQLQDSAQTINLIYAFNSTGKTRLCVEYKNVSKNHETGEHAGVYYNAFSEDLFVWDNDESNSNLDIKLNIQFSSLNQFHSLITLEALQEKLKAYGIKYDFLLNESENPERGIESISFFTSIDYGSPPIKISRGEERIFVWCFFLALFELDVWTGGQDGHFFIDDPVSSLDDQNIFITADSIIDIIDNSDLRKKKIIITTHHVGLFSILYDRLKKGEKSSSYKNLTKCYILKSQDNELVLKPHEKDVFLFHLHLLQTLEIAINGQLYSYHFVLLRQLLENVSSFLGVGNFNYTLEQIGVEKEKANRINSLSHKNVYTFQHHEMSSQEKELFEEIITKLIEKYKFVTHN